MGLQIDLLRNFYMQIIDSGYLIAKLLESAVLQPLGA